MLKARELMMQGCLLSLTQPTNHIARCDQGHRPTQVSKSQVTCQRGLLLIVYIRGVKLMGQMCHGLTTTTPILAKVKKVAIHHVMITCRHGFDTPGLYNQGLKVLYKKYQYLLFCSLFQSDLLNRKMIKSFNASLKVYFGY